jgi:molybdopterin biosynthesis enzyme
MLSYGEALSLMLRVIPEPEAETVPLDEAFGRVLADDCFADRDVPPFDKALMDGYAGISHVAGVASISSARPPRALRVILRQVRPRPFAS